MKKRYFSNKKAAPQKKQSGEVRQHQTDRRQISKSAQRVSEQFGRALVRLSER